MVEHRFEQGDEAVRRHGLIFVVEVAVVLTEIDWHERRDRWLQRVRRHAPEPGRVVQEDVVIDKTPECRNLRVPRLKQPQDRDLRPRSIFRGEPHDQPLRLCGRKARAGGIEIERQGHGATVDHRLHAMFVWPPAREAAEKIPHPIAVGVKDVRPVAMHANSGHLLVIGVAADVIAPIDDENFLTGCLGKAPRRGSAGEAGADHKPACGILRGMI